ncbi:MAG TPA: hypothetical protein VF202_01075 [Trueperaceae bacterium]
MAQTSVYGIPYQGTNDRPNGPLLGKQLAEAVEAELQRIDGSLSNVVSRLPPILPGTCVARLRRSSGSTIPQSTAIPWDAEDWDDLGAHSSGSTRFQPNTPGRYLITAVIRHQAIPRSDLDVGPVPAIFASIAKSGVTVTATVTQATNDSPTAGNGISISDVVALNGTTDYIEVTVGNNQATNVNCSGSVLTATYVGPVV